MSARVYRCTLVQIKPTRLELEPSPNPTQSAYLVIRESNGFGGDFKVNTWLTATQCRDLAAQLLALAGTTSPSIEGDDFTVKT